MQFKTLIPNIFYTDINDGLELFVNCLGFNIAFNDLASNNPFCVIERDGLKAHLVQDAEFAAKDRPELRLETNDIQEAFAKISATHPQFLHPNLSKPTLRPWKATEFALRDATDVCIVIQQWP